MSGEREAIGQADAVTLVEAGSERAGEIAQLHAELFVPCWDEQSVGALLAQPGTRAIVALQAGSPVVDGFILVRRAANEAEILSMGVRASMHRCGLGRRLLEEAAEQLRRDGALRVFLEVASDNVAAHALYSNLGFREVGRRRGYYARPDGAADALVLALGIDGVPPSQRGRLN